LGGNCDDGMDGIVVRDERDGVVGGRCDVCIRASDEKVKGMTVFMSGKVNMLG